MAKKSSYNVPAKTVSVEQEIKRSRFIATVGHAQGREGAMNFIRSVSQEHPGASHNCYGFIGGSPGSGTDIGFGDDGEVSGTAGKPILNILQHKEIGEIIAVVTRYFGGTRLGTGGLVRAYSSSVTMALDLLPLRKYVELKQATVIIPYQFEDPVRRLLGKMDSPIRDALYTDNVSLKIETPVNSAEELEGGIKNITHGQGELIII